MVASLDGDAVAHGALLSRLSGHLRAYFKGQLNPIRRSPVEAEDLVQEVLIGIHIYDGIPMIDRSPSLPGSMPSHATNSSTICAERKRPSRRFRSKSRRRSSLMTTSKA